MNNYKTKYNKTPYPPPMASFYTRPMSSCEPKSHRWWNRSIDVGYKTQIELYKSMDYIENRSFLPSRVMNRGHVRRSSIRDFPTAKNPKMVKPITVRRKSLADPCFTRKKLVKLSEWRKRQVKGKLDLLFGFPYATSYNKGPVSSVKCKSLLKVTVFDLLKSGSMLH